MIKEKVVELILDKHKNAETHLNDLAFKHSEDRYSRKNFQEGYKFALIEVQYLLDSIKSISESSKVDIDFFNSMKVKN